MSSKDLSVVIKTQKTFIKELLKMLVGKDKSEICFKTIEEKLIKACRRYFEYPKTSWDDGCMYVPIHNDFFSVKELKDLLNKDDYFKGLSIEQIFELAKKSIRLTDDNCKMRHKLEDIEEIVNAIYDYQVECKDKTNKEFLDKQLQKISDKLLDK